MTHCWSVPPLSVHWQMYAPAFAELVVGSSMSIIEWQKASFARPVESYSRSHMTWFLPSSTPVPTCSPDMKTRAPMECEEPDTSSASLGFTRGLIMYVPVGAGLAGTKAHVWSELVPSSSEMQTFVP